ncbi:I78 family peptidase inhibitor [Pseudomonas sp. RTB3]|nr:I78 family peptidase inhibitor [Pseudomonas sp. RTB3]
MPWKLASFGSLLAALALAGCSTPGASEPGKDAAVADSGHTRCESKAAEFAVGQKASPQLLDQARTRAGAQNARVLKPSDMVTLEYRSDRLNLNADDRSIITRVNCG